MNACATVMRTRAKRLQRGIAAGVATIMAMLVSACSHRALPPQTKTTGAPAIPGALARPDYGDALPPDAPIAFQPAVVVVAGGSGAIRSVDPDGLTFTIDGSARGAPDLSAGKIMFVTSRLVGRVLSVRSSGRDLVVSLGPAAFPEVVRNARLSFDQEIDLDAIQRSGVRWTQQNLEPILPSPPARMAPTSGLLPGAGPLSRARQSALGLTDSVPHAIRTMYSTPDGTGADRNMSAAPDSEPKPGEDDDMSREPGTGTAPDCEANRNPTAELAEPVGSGHSIIVSLLPLDFEVYYNTVVSPVTNNRADACGQVPELPRSNEAGLRVLFNLRRKKSNARYTSAVGKFYYEHPAKLGFGVKFGGKIHLVGNLVISDGAVDLKQSTIDVEGIDSIGLGMLAGAGSDYQPRDVSNALTLDFAMPVTLGEVPFGAAGIPMVLTISVKPSAQLSIGRNSTMWGNAVYKVSGPIGLVDGKPTTPSFEVQKSLLDSLQGVTVTPIFLSGSFDIKAMVGLGIKGMANSGPYFKIRISGGGGQGSVLGLIKCQQASFEIDMGLGIGLSINQNLFNGVLGAKKDEIRQQVMKILDGLKGSKKIGKSLGEVTKGAGFDSDIEIGESLVPVIGPKGVIRPDVPLCRF